MSDTCDMYTVQTGTGVLYHTLDISCRHTHTNTHIYILVEYIYTDIHEIDPHWAWYIFHLPCRAVYTDYVSCTYKTWDYVFNDANIYHWNTFVTKCAIWVHYKDHWGKLLMQQWNKMGGNRFEPWFGLGSYRWILGEFSSGVYPTVSHLLIHWSKFQTCHPWRSPIDMAIQLSCCPWGHPRKTNSNIIIKQNLIRASPTLNVQCVTLSQLASSSK